MQLRPYQQKSIDDLYAWFHAHPSAHEHPCLVLPTGAGKSVIIASLVQDALTNWPETRVLMLTHQKELIEQNAEKLQSLWPTAPLGVFSASLKKKVLHRAITYAGIQSIHKRADELGHIDLVIVDECHLINHKESGIYRNFLSNLRAINPRARFIGLTATPYRMGCGIITESDYRIFTDIIEPVNVGELIALGFLARLESKGTEFKIDTSRVKKSGGEFSEKSLQELTDTAEIVDAITRETLVRSGGLRSILWFCTGIENAHHYAEKLIGFGEEAHVITGDTPHRLRDETLRAFKAGEFRHLTNANVLTTGFDAPNIDGIVLARPVLSPALYVQMVGRGLRLKNHTDHCKVFDFAGNIARHGPITDVTPPNAPSGMEAPTKECPNPECMEVVLAFAKVCPSCGHVFVTEEEPKKKDVSLRSDDIMGGASDPVEMHVSSVRWSPHVSRKTGNLTIKAKYVNASMIGENVDEYFSITHEKEFIRKKGRAAISEFIADTGIVNHAFLSDALSDIYCASLSDGELAFEQAKALCSIVDKNQRQIVSIMTQKRGKFFNITKRNFK